MPLDKTAIHKANILFKHYGTSNPETIANELGIHIHYTDCNGIKGMYAYILRNRFIVIDNNLGNTEKKIVLAHELGHDQLHRGSCFGAFSDNRYISYQNHRREIEANIFSSQLLISDDDFFELFENAYTYDQIAKELRVFPELLAIKVDILREKGIKINPYETGSKDFLKNKLENFRK